MNRRSLFGISGAIFLIMAVFLAALGIWASIMFARNGYTDIKHALKYQQEYMAPGMSPILTLRHAVLYVALETEQAISIFLTAAILYILGKALLKFRYDVESALRNSQNFLRLAVLFLAAYVLNIVDIFLVQGIMNPFRYLKTDNELSAMGDDRVIWALIPHFDGAAALVMALLLLIIVQISRTYSEKIREVSDSKNL